MTTNNTPPRKAEELLAEVAAAAYRVAVQHGFKGAFIDVELDVWSALQGRLRRSMSGNAAETAPR